MKETVPPVNFRPTKASRGVLDDAKKVGLELTGFINGILEAHGQEYVTEAAQKKIQQIKQMLAAR